MRVAYIAENIHPGHWLWLDTLKEKVELDIIKVRGLVRVSHVTKVYDLAISEGFRPTPVAILLRRARIIKKLYMVALSPAINSRKFRILSHHVNGIIAVSSLVKSLIQRQGYNRPIYILHPSPPEIDLLLPVSPCYDSHNLCFIGAPAYYKGGDRLKALIKEVRKEVPQAKLFLIGGKLEAEGIVSLGRISQKDKLRILANCSLYVHPARLDAFAISVLEAMAAGLIPVVTPTTGSAEVVVQVDPSLVVGFNKMPHKVIELLNRDLSKLSEKCKEVALKHRSRVISEVDTLLHTLVSET